MGLFWPSFCVFQVVKASFLEVVLYLVTVVRLFLGFFPIFVVILCLFRVILSLFSRFWSLWSLCKDKQNLQKKNHFPFSTVSFSTFSLSCISLLPFDSFFDVLSILHHLVVSLSVFLVVFLWLFSLSL